MQVTNKLTAGKFFIDFSRENVLLCKKIRAMYCENCNKKLTKKRATGKKAQPPANNEPSVYTQTIMGLYMEYAKEHPEVLLNLLLF